MLHRVSITNGIYIHNMHKLQVKKKLKHFSGEHKIYLMVYIVYLFFVRLNKK